MTLPILLTGLIILILLSYIIYLQIQLSKKNIFIETTLKRLSGIEKTRSIDEMTEFLKELGKTGAFNPALHDKFPDEKISNFILENDDRLKIFMHYTRYEDDARNILRQGFLFANYFHKTALQVTRDKLDMIIKHNSQKYYGHFLVVISISAGTVNKYTEEIRKSGLKNVSFENIITESPVRRNENGEPLYTLPKHFIKGYINHISGEITVNPDYNPDYISPSFDKNLLSFKQ